MVVDYSEKRVNREVERKQVPKNRPRKEPVGMFALLSVMALVAAFGMGLVTGWFLFKGSKKPVPVAAVAQAAKKDEPAPVQPPPNPAGEAPLTFYKTLPAGSKGTMGTGLNLKKPEPAAAPHPAVPAVPSAAPAPAPSTAPAAAPAPAAPAASHQKADDGNRYLVQIASYRDKKEADSAQSKLAAKGVAAYVVETKLAEKGVWYRVRVGRHLTKAEADEMAGRYGKGTMVIAE